MNPPAATNPASAVVPAPTVPAAEIAPAAPAWRDRLAATLAASVVIGLAYLYWSA